MKTEIKEKWLKALRSDDYQQTTGTLCDEKGYCCLGVLLDVVDKSQWRKTPLGTTSWGERQLSVDLDKKAMDEIGVTFEQQENLIEMNDNEYCSFREIANWIEENIMETP